MRSGNDLKTRISIPTGPSVIARYNWADDRVTAEIEFDPKGKAVRQTGGWTGLSAARMRRETI